MTTTRRWVAPLLATVIALALGGWLLAGCAGQGATEAVSATPIGGTAAADDPTGEPAAAEAVESPSAADGGESDEEGGELREAGGAAGADQGPGGRTPFGATASWDGLEATVSAPEEFDPTEAAFGHEQTTAVRFEVRVVNTGDAPWDPADLLISAQVDGMAGGGIFDQGIDGPPLEPVPPGGEAVWVEAFSVDAADGVVVLFDPFATDGAEPAAVFVPE